RLQVGKASCFVDDGIKPVFRVCTALGREIHTTLTHPFLTLGGWRPLAQLRVGERIAVPRRLPYFGPLELSEQHLEALAREIAISTGVSHSQLRSYSYPRDGCTAQAVELPGPDISPALPERIFRLSRQSLALFLNKLLGFFPVLTGKDIGLLIGCGGEQIFREVQHLLLRFGVNAGVSRQEGLCQLTVGGQDALVFIEQVGIEGYKSELARLAQFLTKIEPDMGNSADLYWDRIANIQYLGKQQVYDLTVPDTHNFIAEDMLVHNTTFAMNIAEHVAIKKKLPVAVFSMEMPGDHLAMRMMSSLGRIDQHRIRTGKLQEDDWPRLTSAVSLLAEARLYIDDSSGLSPTEIRARARRLMRENDGELGLILIDYLQLMQIPGNNENRATEISEISRSLKSLARELNVPVIALSQLNRSLEQRPNKRPVMSDLRECVTGDTLVVLTDGRRIPIRDLVGQQPEVWSLGADDRLQAAVSDGVWSVGVKPVLRVTLSSGRMIRATAEHRLYGANGWVKIKNLKQSDLLALARTFCKTKNTFEKLGQAEAITTNSDLFWDEVVAIEPDGEEEVFDLTVPGPASWLADGIVSHNSGAIEQDADVISFIYRDEVYNPESSEKGMAEIIIGKQRNGPIGTVKLTFLGKYTRFENFAADSYADGEF
ncbi:MAG: DnaB-like helicase C-terminal domain-containing protein, partial [Candidatus Competibacteraceae bacterium]|nr:DnaB-like helicase C-terminal domain-containing protein [Candidatus Competibacteraceae bacterium]